ncbi:YccF domain-containing protein [Serratia sp. S1B]|nr:YccF domain-containing protein [Serratia sp. S1B]
MRTVLNILNFVLGGCFTTLGWLVATFFTIILIFTLPLTRSCWEITKISFLPFGNEVISVDELYPEKGNTIQAAGSTLLNIFWFVLFGWWLCLSHVAAGILQCATIIGIPVGITNFKIAAIALWPVGRRVVSVEMAQVVRSENARRQYHQR